jgi:hypothetical protein
MENERSLLPFQREFLKRNFDIHWHIYSSREEQTIVLAAVILFGLLIGAHALSFRDPELSPVARSFFATALSLLLAIVVGVVILRIMLGYIYNNQFYISIQY